MPELPEVETIKESLQGMVGLTIDDIKVMKPEYIRSWENRPADYIGQRISAISRRGKFLIFETDTG
ncbi:MAG TPA: DNA-formamidopyrimidine glycosylase, partial [Syntrophomonas sp.]|nr:DNA-formamidopyrimidine glycosylase [Syntrophomonas sp.]